MIPSGGCEIPCEVQAFKREIHFVCEFSTTRAVELKPFEMYYEYGWETPQCKALAHVTVTLCVRVCWVEGIGMRVTNVFVCVVEYEGEREKIFIRWRWSTSIRTNNPCQSSINGNIQNSIVKFCPSTCCF
jgi:hypothetical protein